MHRCLAPTIALTAALLLAACSQRDTLGPSRAADIAPESTATATVDATEPIASDPTSPGEVLFAIPPRGWALESATTTGKLRRARYLRDPEAEYVESLTIETFPAEDSPDPLLFLDGLAADEADRCDGFSRQGIFAGEEAGLPAAVELLQCPYRSVNGRAWTRLVKAIQGTTTYAVVTLGKEGRALRGDDGWVTNFTTDDDIANWALYLKSTTLRVADKGSGTLPPAADQPSES
ncbi:MAG: hypothetical protein AAF648_00310 [Pseudomonadota bacterium]